MRLSMDRITNVMHSYKHPIEMTMMTTHATDVIGIKNTSSKHQANSALILNEYFAQRFRNDGKSESLMKLKGVN